MWRMTLSNSEYLYLKEQKWIILDFGTAQQWDKACLGHPNANYHNLERCIQQETIAKWSDKLVTDIKINYV